MKSDLQLQAEVMDHLRWESSINSAAIGVEVSNGLVTITGEVDTFFEKWTIERLIQKIPDVRTITVELDVRFPGSSTNSDFNIANKAERVLCWLPNNINRNIRLMVEDGWITLFGSVVWEQHRRTIEEALKDLPGVKGIVNKITLEVEHQPGDIMPAIERALKRIYKSQRHNIRITIDGSKVTLSGSVKDWKEREMVENVVSGVTGVSQVIDRIAVLA